MIVPGSPQDESSPGGEATEAMRDVTEAETGADKTGSALELLWVCLGWS